MVEVVGNINKLYIGKAQEKYDGEKPVKPTKGNGSAGQGHERKNGIHTKARQRLYPIKTKVIEMQRWIHQLRIYPTHIHVAQGAK